jgi:ubiquinone/menaquinone biosynthesis C-methylase UbiE
MAWDTRMSGEYRFQGAMSEEYRWIQLAIPGFEALQASVGHVIAGYEPLGGAQIIEVLEIGCGDGVTSATILGSRKDCVLTALDSEANMIAQASANLRDYVHGDRCRLVLTDALTHLKTLPPRSVDVVASALCLHNMQQSYRASLYAQIFRLLKLGGQFVNADKYAANEAQRFDALHLSLAKLFEVLVPLGKLNLLRECVLHNVADQEPDRVMWEEETEQILLRLGFSSVEIPYRDNLQAVLVATKAC